jgi:FF domain.
MLREKGIMPFSDYEKFLPKIINDDRFKGIVITNLKF